MATTLGIISLFSFKDYPWKRSRSTKTYRFHTESKGCNPADTVLSWFEFNEVPHCPTSTSTYSRSSVASPGLQLQAVAVSKAYGSLVVLAGI